MALDRKGGLFRPLANVTRAEFAVAVGCRLLACILVVAVIAFVVAAATPFVFADGWFYVAHLIRPWQDGHLSIADFFVSRGPSDHIQPIYRLVMLMHTAWFHMDFTVEALIGVAFAIACVYLWYRLARHELSKSPGTAIAAQLTGLGLVAVVFSLNARGVFDWPLVALAFMGIFVVSLLLAATPVLLERRGIASLAGLAALTLLVFLVDDTYGILAVACAAVLLTLMRARGQVAQGAWLRATLLLVAVAVAYIIACRVFFPYTGNAPDTRGLGPLIGLMKSHWRESWKLIAIPAGTTIAMPERLAQAFGISADAAPKVIAVLAVPVCAANIWFWVGYWRRKPNALTFAAAGLMLFFYASLAAVLVSRLPRFGFDYMYEPRYMQVYELQLVAILMMSAQVLSEQPRRRVHRGVLTAAVLVLVSLAFAYVRMTSREVPYIRAYQKTIAMQMEQIGADPKSPLADCMASYIVPCTWTPAARAAAFQTLERGPYNVFSPVFRRWHKRQVPAAAPLSGAAPLTPQPVTVGGE